MRAVEVKDAFGLENVSVSERTKPEPGPGQVLVKMQAACLNYRDLMTVRGEYNPRQPLPLIPCSDGAGEVEALGQGVTSVNVGDKVATTFFQDWQSGKPEPSKIKTTLGGPLDGTLAEYMVLSEKGVIQMPEYLSAEEAATLPCAALTAWSAIVSEGKVKAGDRVLIQGTGGVALFALQFAKILGAQVIITSSSDEKLEKTRELGADHVVNYKKTPEWGKAVRKLTDGLGVDVVVELGGAGTLPQSFQACCPGGKIALIGVLSGIIENLNIIPIIMQNLHVQGIFVGTREHFAEMNRALAQHKIRPIIDKTFALEQSVEAFKYMASAAHFGKICITI